MQIKKTKIKPAFEDERGAIYDLLDKEKIYHIGMITSKKGSVRGNHYHKEAKQINYIFSGRMQLKTKNMKNKNSKIETIILEEGDIISIPAMVAHSLKALEDTTFFIFTDKQRADGGYEEDTHRIDI